MNIHIEIGGYLFATIIIIGIVVAFFELVKFSVAAKELVKDKKDGS